MIVNKIYLLFVFDKQIKVYLYHKCLKQISMKKIATKNFTAELILERSISSVPTKIGKHDSSIELYSFEEDPDYYLIEWDIPTLEMVENIGIWCEEGTKILRDYDGVFALPEEVMEMLREQGFDVEYAE